jgi:repressor LexA
MITAKQRRILDYLHEFQRKGLTMPSYAEMVEGLGLSSKSHAHRYVMALEERGFIRRLPGRARAIEVIKLPKSKCCPHCGERL